MTAWKIIYIDPRNGAELPLGYIDENNQVSGIGKKSIKQCLKRHGWPKTSPTDVYAGRPEIKVVEDDPHIPIYSRPRDDSLEAYKGWINEMFSHLTGKSGDDGSMTEEEWIRHWKEFLAAKPGANTRKAKGHGKDNQ